MSFTVQKWDNNTAEIAYKLYAFDTDFIIEKEVLTGTSTESTYYNSNVSRETIAAAWTARASKTYDYKLKENLVDNRFNRNFLALQDSYSCSLFESARKGINIKVEDFPLLWIEGNGGSGYYGSYTGDTFQISGNGCVFGGSTSDYAAIETIDLEDKSLTTDFTNKLLNKFVNLDILTLTNNSIDLLDVTSLSKLKELRFHQTSVSSIDVSKNVLLNTLGLFGTSVSVLDTSQNPLLSILSAYDTTISVFDFSDNPLLLRLTILNTNITSIDVSNNPLLTNLNLDRTAISTLDISNNTNLVNFTSLNCELSNVVNSDILININNSGKQNGYFASTIFGGGALTSAAEAAKTSLQGKGWTIVGL
jgi:hypothetical protein